MISKVKTKGYPYGQSTFTTKKAEYVDDKARILFEQEYEAEDLDVPSGVRNLMKSETFYLEGFELKNDGTLHTNELYLFIPRKEH